MLCVLCLHEKNRKHGTRNGCCPMGELLEWEEKKKKTYPSIFFSHNGFKWEVFQHALGTARLQKTCGAGAVMFTASLNPWHGLRLCESGLFPWACCAYVGFTLIVVFVVYCMVKRTG